MHDHISVLVGDLGVFPADRVIVKLRVTEKLCPIDMSNFQIYIYIYIYIYIHTHKLEELKRAHRFFVALSFAPKRSSDRTLTESSV